MSTLDTKEAAAVADPTLARARLELSGVNVSYGQSSVIRGVSFAVRENEILAVMGRNGMGKTTLFKAIMGLLPVREGSILLDGVNITAERPHRRVAQGLAYVPQGRMIFSHLSVLENLMSATRGVVEKSDLDAIYALFPVLHEMRNRKGGNLSGGQQQQLAIGRALLTNPKVLVLDEPTEGIQPSIIKDLARTLRRIRDERQLTILVSEQVLSFVADACDRLLVIQRGEIVHEETGDLSQGQVRALLAI